jgi:hypothetical protein
MYQSSLRQVVACVMAFHVLCLGFSPAAEAEVIGTQTVLELGQREARLNRINAALMRADVQREMLDLGVAPSEVRERLAAISDEELREMDGQLENLPAGGSLAAAIGVVFVVLIILELVGVTNVFTKL